MLETEYINTCNLMQVRAALDALSQIYHCQDHGDEIHSVVASLIEVRNKMFINLHIEA